MDVELGYCLAPGIQVRKELFGLLFYDYRGPRLYFVPTENAVSAGFFSGRERVRDLLERLCGTAPQSRNRLQQQVLQILDQLERKGLICGQSIR